MASSILDYIFRELAISYLGRNDLAHVQPDDVNAAAEAARPDDDQPGASASRVVSKGLTRGRAQNFLAINGGQMTAGGTTARSQMQADASGGSNIFAFAGNTALKPEPLEAKSVEALFTPGAKTAASQQDARAVARMKGYLGEACGECQNMTLVQNGTCKKCETCGATTGCS
jgi:ribonucleoside-diphosphate reductase alpha chain